MSTKNMDESQSLLAVSPLDGRYAKQTQPLVDYFSEFALIRSMDIGSTKQA